MDAEERTLIAITVTREILTNMMDDPGAMVVMSAEDLDPEVLQDTVYTILEYLDKTKPEASP